VSVVERAHRQSNFRRPQKPGCVIPNEVRDLHLIFLAFDFSAFDFAGAPPLRFSRVGLDFSPRRRTPQFNRLNAKNDLSLTQALGYSHSKEACDREKPVRCNGGESGKDPAGKIGAAK
jgi:hypothetical protein